MKVFCRIDLVGCDFTVVSYWSSGQALSEWVVLRNMSIANGYSYSGFIGAIDGTAISCKR